MGRPVHADGRQTRQAILDAALDLFAEKGYFGTSLRDIAGIVGVRESALYNYFPGKEALFNALLEADEEHRAEAFAEILRLPIGSAREVLDRLAMGALESFCQPRQQQIFCVLMSDGMRLAKEGRINLLERMTSAKAPLRDLMRRLIAIEGLRPRDPEFLALEFIGPLLLWRHRHALGHSSAFMTNRKAFVRNHVDQFLKGAMPQAAARVKPARHRGPASAPRRRTTRMAS
jgi:AcrR family transcriptional regulator